MKYGTKLSNDQTQEMMRHPALVRTMTTSSFKGVLVRGMCYNCGNFIENSFGCFYCKTNGTRTDNYRY